MYVCSLITLERKGRMSPYFQGVQGWFYAQKICAFLGQKFGEGLMDRGQKIGIFVSRGTLPAMCHSKQIGHRNGTGQGIGAQTGAGGQCALHL